MTTVNVPKWCFFSTQDTSDCFSSNQCKGQSLNHLGLLFSTDLFTIHSPLSTLATNFPREINSYLRIWNVLHPSFNIIHFYAWLSFCQMSPYRRTLSAPLYNRENCPFWISYPFNPIYINLHHNVSFMKGNFLTVSTIVSGTW